jgi:hypothetical protein
MPNKIDTDSIIRDRQDKMHDSADQSNADYVTQLEQSVSLMPPEKPYETEHAQVKTTVKEESDPTQTNDFVQNVKESTYEIQRIDKTNETKLHLLTAEHQKVADKLKDPMTKKDQANLESVLNDVERTMELYRSKLKAGATASLSVGAENEATDEDGNGEDLGSTIIDGLKDQILTAAPLIIAGKDEEEEEEEKEKEEKEYDQ